MTRVPMTQAVAADYADAMLVARRAKNVLFLLLLLILLIQVSVFLIARYVPSVKIQAEVPTSLSTAGPTTTTSTDISVLGSKASENGGPNQFWSPLLREVIAVTDFLGVVFAVVLPIILLLVLTIMLVGRLVGVSHVTSAFCWSIVLLVLLFPWQSLLNRHVHESDSGLTPAASVNEAAAPDVRIPGVLYTFPELSRDYNFPAPLSRMSVLKWARYAAFPLVAIILLFIIQRRSGRGLRFALGEADLPVELASPGSVNPPAY